MALSVLFVSQVLVGASSAQKIRAGEGALGEERVGVWETPPSAPALPASGRCPHSVSRLLGRRTSDIQVIATHLTPLVMWSMSLKTVSNEIALSDGVLLSNIITHRITHSPNWKEETVEQRFTVYKGLVILKKFPVDWYIKRELSE